jgi:hypothetical protein
MKTMLCLGAILASAAAANIEAVDERSDRVMEAIATSNDETDALLASVDRLASGQMTPAERRAWEADLKRRSRDAQSMMQRFREGQAPQNGAVAR